MEPGFTLVLHCCRPGLNDDRAITSWYRIYLTHYSHGAYLGESVCISLLYYVECILAGHVLSECDTVAFLWGIANMIVVIWYLANNWQNLVMLRCRCWRLSRHFIHCSMLWITFIGQHDDSPVSSMIQQDVKYKSELRSLPPTAEAFQECVHRAHLQRAIWRASFDGDPLGLNPVNYRWSSDVASDMLVLVPQMFHQQQLKYWRWLDVDVLIN